MPLVSCIVDTDGTGDYSSLNAAEAANFGATSADLVTNDEWVECDCQCTSGSADTTGVTIDGLSTAVDNDVKIFCDSDGDYAHEGAWDSLKYRLNNYRALSIEISHLTVEQVQFLTDGSASSDSWPINAAEDIDGLRLKRLLIRHEIISDNNERYAIDIDRVASGEITNCIVIRESTSEATRGGIQVNEATGDFLVANNTIYYNGTHGIRRFINASQPIVRNNIVINNGTGPDFDESGFSDASNNISSDTTAPGANSLTNQVDTDLFEDPANGDFTLKSDSNAIDAGTDLSDDMDSVDIAGTSRPSGEWDIGAFEYVSAATVVTVSADLDAYISKAIQQTTSADALLSKSFTLDLSVDAVLAALRSVVSDLDGVLSKQIQSTTDLDALVQGSGKSTTDIDALLKKIVTRSLSLDGLLQVTGQAQTSTACSRSPGKRRRFLLTLCSEKSGSLRQRQSMACSEKPV